MNDLRVRTVENSHLLKHPLPTAIDEPFLQIGSEPDVQPIPILRAVFSILLKLHDVSSNQPVADDERLIDDGGSATEQLLAGRINGLDELAYFMGVSG